MSGYKSLHLISVIILILIFFSTGSTAAPITYTCCKNFTTNTGVLIQSFDNAALWTLSPSGTSSKGQDNTHFIEGTGSVYLDTGNVAVAQARADMSLTLTHNQTIGVWAYSSNWSQVASVTILYYQGTKYGDKGSMGKGFNNNTFSNTASNDSGWQYFTLNTSQFTFVNMSVTDPITYMRIKITPSNVGVPARVSFDKNIVNFEARPKFFFDFDDGRENVSLMAYPVMASNNQRGTIFIPTLSIGASPDAGGSYLNTLEINNLYNNGWDISSHIIHHLDMRTMSNDTLDNEINGSFDYFYNNGFTRSAWFIAYPVGGYDDNIILRSQKRYLIGRTVNDASWSANIQPTDPDTMHLRQTEFGSGVSVQAIKNEINNTIARNGSMHFLIHGLTNDKASYVLNYNLTNFTEVSNYVALRVTQGDIDVATYGDMVIKNIPNNTPLKNNKTTTIYTNGTSQVTVDNYENDETVNLLVTPTGDATTVNISEWLTSGTYHKKWVADSNTDSTTVIYTLGDLPTNRLINLTVGNIQYTVKTNSTGYIVNFNYSDGFATSKIVEVTPTDLTCTINSTTHKFKVNACDNKVSYNITMTGNDTSVTVDTDFVSGIVYQLKYMNGTIAQNSTTSTFTTSLVNGTTYQIVKITPGWNTTYIVSAIGGIAILGYGLWNRRKRT